MKLEGICNIQASVDWILLLGNFHKPFICRLIGLYCGLSLCASWQQVVLESIDAFCLELYQENMSMISERAMHALTSSARPEFFISIIFRIQLFHQFFK